ncbi:MAG TPA: hypothetical protein VL460_01505 [Caulobacteraceae bacterium]|nr:hypothetical protein [Caulobacteraceae bacterium]
MTASHRKIAAAAAVACLAAVPAAAPAQQPAPPRPAPKPSVYADYHPSLSDMMTMAVQPRHTKLGLAIRARNWVYAAYEVGELRGAFTRITRSIPTYEGKDSADLMTMIAKPIDTLQAAIKARDPGTADRAYGEVTNTCNMCHEAQERTYIVIRPPVAAMYSDQDFTAKR